MRLNDPSKIGPEAAREASVEESAFTRSDAEETYAFLALASIRGIGQKTLIALAETGRTFQEIFERGPEDFALRSARREKPVGLREWSTTRRDALERSNALAEQLNRLGITLLFRSSPSFPATLMSLEKPPHWLFVQGSIERLSEPSIAIVGTRKPSPDGYFLARYVGACLSDWGAPTVSGLADGIDRLAHEHSLRAGVPTVAVLGTGMLEDYPKGSGRLREYILSEGGSIVSEYLPHLSYSAENFVQRNRIQAALGRMLIPVEWNPRSGTAHTVRFATALKRPIACLFLPEWSHDRVLLRPGVGLPGGRVFTVPRDHNCFDAFVRSSLGPPPSDEPNQFSLFPGG